MNERKAGILIIIAITCTVVMAIVTVLTAWETWGIMLVIFFVVSGFMKRCFEAINALKKKKDQVLKVDTAVMALIAMGCMIVTITILAGLLALVEIAYPGWPLVCLAGVVNVIMGIVLRHDMRDFRRESREAEDARILSEALAFIGGFLGQPADEVSKDRVGKVLAVTRRRVHQMMQSEYATLSNIRKRYEPAPNPDPTKPRVDPVEVIVELSRLLAKIHKADDLKATLIDRVHAAFPP
nr:hypothetical protein [Candidatus Sigynarchaeota archaeon]